MHLFCRVNAAERHSLELMQDLEAGLNAFDLADAVARQVLGRGARDQR
jgi:hypothetical protein